MRLIIVCGRFADVLCTLQIYIPWCPLLKSALRVISDPFPLLKLSLSGMFVQRDELCDRNWEVYLSNIHLNDAGGVDRFLLICYFAVAYVGNGALSLAA